MLPLLKIIRNFSDTHSYFTVCRVDTKYIFVNEKVKPVAKQNRELFSFSIFIACCQCRIIYTSDNGSPLFRFNNLYCPHLQTHQCRESRTLCSHLCFRWYPCLVQFLECSKRISRATECILSHYLQPFHCRICSVLFIAQLY